MERSKRSARSGRGPRRSLMISRFSSRSRRAVFGGEVRDRRAETFVLHDEHEHDQRHHWSRYLDEDPVTAQGLTVGGRSCNPIQCMDAPGRCLP